MGGINIKGERYGEKSDIAEGIKDFVEPSDIRAKGNITEYENIMFSKLNMYLLQLKEILEDDDFISQIQNIAENIEKRKLSVDGIGRKDAVRIFTKEMKDEIEERELFKKMINNESRD